MITRKNIVDKAAGILGVQNDDQELDRLGRLLNNIVVAASEQHSFNLLRRKTEISLASADTTSGAEGTWLPGNLAGIDAVQDKATGRMLARRDYSEINNMEYGRARYSVYSPGTQPAFYAEDLTIAKGSESFTSVSLDTDGTDYTGHWIQFGSDAMFYELTDEKTISPKYWGPNLSNTPFQIQPPTQLKLIVHDDHDTQLRSGTVIVYYWIFHPMMYRENDLCLLPNSRWIDLMMMREAKGVLGRRTRSPLDQQIDEAWKQLIRINPSFVVPTHPHGRMGNPLDPSNIGYIRRNGPRDGHNVRLSWLNREDYLE